MTLANELAEAEERVGRLKQQIKSGACAETGCDMQSIGGCNASCCKECGCSVPVYVCTKCGDSDYGDNDEATQIRAECNEGYGPGGEPHA